MSTAFAMTNADGSPRFTARQVLEDTLLTSAVMFARDPGHVMFNNVRRDIPGLLRGSGNSRLVRLIANELEARFTPSHDKARYDHGILGQSLTQHFGDLRMRETAKSNFVLAHNMDDARPSVFGHIDEAAFPGEGLDLCFAAEHEAQDDGRLSLHGGARITSALKAATAMPGVIGYYKVPSVERHFMDTGSFGYPTLALLAQDMHTRAENRAARLKTEPAGRWPRIKGLNATFGKRAKPPETVTRLIMLGIGDEKRMGFDRSGMGGVVSEAGTIVRAAADMTKAPSLIGLRNRFNRPSMAATGMPALRSIDTPIVDEAGRPFAGGPSPDITDGRPENLERLLTFGVRLAAANGAMLADELQLRAQTLATRGTISTAQAKDAVLRAEILRQPGGTEALCDQFLTSMRDVGRFIIERTPTPKAVPEASRGRLAGWLPTLRRATPQEAAPTPASA
ncbi:MAG: hypothetical protein H6866_08135 [Rhodospirillales bacterium]|nr:MAG: hypothetical protein H6866_08135 [Rhodospirillales bacterium]